MGPISWQDLYTKHTGLYDEMVRGEDYQGQLLAALRQIHPLAGKEIAEFGAGTGRLTTQLVAHARRVSAFDLTPAMLALAKKKLKATNQTNWILGVADSRAMPLPTASVDLAVEGWSIAQIKAWNPDTWRDSVGMAVQEMLRVVRPGGVIILIETLGTGETVPHAPDQFAPLYDYFEQTWWMSRTWIRTDYLYPSQSAAQQTIGALFGEAVVAKGWESEGGYVIPECTGIWWVGK